jgi:hypothetical protein
MTSSVPREIVRVRPHDPPSDRRLAAIHLRMGQLGLARAELEALAGSGGLDDQSLLVLAEARWRTGDLTGAGDAAHAYLATGGDDVVALVIAAEATAAVGRPTEARRLAGRVLERTDVPLDRIFAGQRRSLIWPVDTTQPAQSEVTVPTAIHEAQTEVVAVPSPPEAAVESYERESAAGAEAIPEGESGSAEAAPVEAAPATEPDGFWDLETIRGEDVPSPREGIATARSDLVAGDLASAAIHLGLALRLDANLAGDVLDVTDSLVDRTPELELIRGDALRLVGREDDARRAYAEASMGIGRRQARGIDDDRPPAVGQFEDREEEEGEQ